MNEHDRGNTGIHIRAILQEAAKDDSGLIEMFDYLGVEWKFLQEETDSTGLSATVCKWLHPRSLWFHDERQIIVSINRHFLDNYGDCRWKYCHLALMGEDSICGCCKSRSVFSNKAPQHCNLCKRKQSCSDINIFHIPVTNIEGDRFILKLSFEVDYSASIFTDATEEEQEESSFKQLLICCSTCHRVKDTENNWFQADTEILEHYGSRVSHGICPECITLLYPYLRDLSNCNDIKTSNEP